MPTFPKGSPARRVYAGNAARLAKLSGQAQTTNGKVTWLVDPVDDRALRGIPCVGSRAGGAIRGTRPGDGLH